MSQPPHSRYHIPLLPDGFFRDLLDVSNEGVPFQETWEWEAAEAAIASVRLDLAQQYLEAAVRCEEVLALPRSFSGRVALAVYRSQAFAVIYSLGVMSLLVLSGLEDKAHWHVAVLSLCALDMCLGVAASTFTQYFKRPWHVALGISMIVLLINNLCM